MQAIEYEPAGRRLAVLARGENEGARGRERDDDVRALAEPSRPRVVEELGHHVLGRALPGQPAGDVQRPEAEVVDVDDDDGERVQVYIG